MGILSNLTANSVFKQTFVNIMNLSKCSLILEGATDDVDGKSKRHSLIASISVAAAALSSVQLDESSDSAPEDTKQKTSVPATKGDNKGDTTDGIKMSRLQRMRRLRSVEMKVKKTKSGSSASGKFFVALFWGILLSRLWIHMWVFQLLPIPIGIYLFKRLMSRTGAWDFVESWFWLVFAKLKAWVLIRQDALAPAPIRGLGKLIIQGDKKVKF